MPKITRPHSMLAVLALLLLACSLTSRIPPTEVPASSAPPVVPPTDMPTATVPALPTATSPAAADLRTATDLPAAALTSTVPPAPTGPAPVEVFQPAQAVALAYEHIDVLANVIGARPSGSPEEGQAADYIWDVFQELGYTPERQDFTFSSTREDNLESANLIAVKPGLSDQVILVGAHYDSGDEGDGADDNASGLAVLLTLAELVAEMDTPYTVYFVAFGAEENDLDGSRYYVRQAGREDLGEIITMINLDSLIAGDILYAYGDEGSNALYAWIVDAADEAGIDLEAMDDSNMEGCACSDYAPFEAAGVPYVYFEGTNWNLGDQDGYTQVDLGYGEDGMIWHTRFDTLDYIESTFPGRAEEHLESVLTLLFGALTEFE